MPVRRSKKQRAGGPAHRPALAPSRAARKATSNLPRAGAPPPKVIVAEAVAEPLLVFEPGLSRAERLRRVAEMLDRVELPAAIAERLPHAISGGRARTSCTAPG